MTDKRSIYRKYFSDFKFDPIVKVVHNEEYNDLLRLRNTLPVHPVYHKNTKI